MTDQPPPQPPYEGQPYQQGGYPPPQPPAGYGNFPPPMPAPPPGLKSGFAVGALICGLLAPFALFAAHGMGFVMGAAAIVCAVLALRQISKGVGTGRGMAVWGLVLGILFGLAGLGGMTSENKTSGTSTASTASSGSGAATRAVVPTAPAVAAPAPTATTIPGEGTYLVGSEITPGTYRSPGAKKGFFEFCSYTRLRDTSGGSGAMIDMGTANANEPMIVTIAPSDGAFKSSGCEDWTRIK
jgi:hypothetical protein